MSAQTLTQAGKRSADWRVGGVTPARPTISVGPACRTEPLAIASAKNQGRQCVTYRVTQPRFDVEVVATEVLAVEVLVEGLAASSMGLKLSPPDAHGDRCLAKASPARALDRERRGADEEPARRRTRKLKRHAGCWRCGRVALTNLK